MRVVIQRVQRALVTINKSLSKSIGKGLVILIGFEEDESSDDLKWLSNKIVQLRVFDDKQGVMNLSLLDISGEIMLISQFTLHAKVKKGNRPSYIQAAKPDIAIPLYNRFIEQLEIDLDKKIITGEFGAHMDIELINDGPVTIIIDTKNKE